MRTTTLGIDPGPTSSGVAWVGDDLMPLATWLVPNGQVITLIRDWWLTHNEPTLVGIEQIASYGMPVGREVFETAEWSGRFAQLVEDVWGLTALMIPRMDVKMALCHSTRANDATIRMALVDRFAPGTPNRGKGTKAAPGWFYGFRRDTWAAYAVAVTAADRATGADR